RLPRWQAFARPLVDRWRDTGRSHAIATTPGHSTERHHGEMCRDRIGGSVRLSRTHYRVFVMIPALSSARATRSSPWLCHSRTPRPDWWGRAWGFSLRLTRNERDGHSTRRCAATATNERGGRISGREIL